MSSPTKNSQLDLEDRLKYAPPWARRQGPKEGAEPPAPAAEAARDKGRGVYPRDLGPPETCGPAIDEEPAVAANAPARPPTWLREPARAFEGDVAMRELRTRMALDPQLVPEPPRPPSRKSVVKRAVRLFAIVGFSAWAAYLVVLAAFPDENNAPSAAQEGSPAPSAARMETPRFVLPDRAAPARLVLIESRRAAADEAVPLGVTLTNALDRGMVVVSGLPARARLSAGEPFEPGAWRVPAADLARTALEAPPGFAGVMEIAVELRSSDDAIADRSAMRIEWTPLPAAPDQTQAPAPDPGSRASAATTRPGNAMIEREEIAALVKRGRDFIANGDLASARLVLRRAADGGDAQAALLLGSTYDPAIFKQLRVIGSAPDPAQARLWYHRAAELGSAEAAHRLERLAEGAR